MALPKLQEVALEVGKDGVAVVTLNRPKRMNAFTNEMGYEIATAMRFCDLSDAVRVVILTGQGKAFCAGADLGAGGDSWTSTGADAPINVEDLDANAPKSIRNHRDSGGAASLAIWRCRKPVIAAINGSAVGVGVTMTLAADMRIVTADAKIGFVFARRGIVPEACSAYFLPRIVGVAKALEWCFSGRVFKAKEEPVLFNYVVESPDAVRAKAFALAREIAANTSAVSVALTKAMLTHPQPTPEDQHLLDSKVLYHVFSKNDSKEGVVSFLEKRPPKFTLSPTHDLPGFYPWWPEPTVVPRSRM
eukprot:Hpha_TRINITY_DN15774_c1_g1::TRINITY_DN15774_c1_g1_i1::g.40575::m.40575